MFTQTAKWRQLSAMPTSSRCLLVIMKMCSLCRLCCVAQAPAFRPGPIMTRTESRIARRCRAIRHDSTNPERRRGELTPAAGRTSLPSRLTKQNQVKGRWRLARAAIGAGRGTNLNERRSACRPGRRVVYSRPGSHSGSRGAARARPRAGREAKRTGKTRHSRGPTP